MFDLLYPHKCQICGKDADILCEDCLKKGDYYFYQSFKLPSIDDADSPLIYRDFVRQAMHRYKFNGRRSYADWFAKFTAECIQSKLDIWKPDFITYVPLSFGRWFKRGFNQSELVAKIISKKLDLPLEKTLVKRAFIKKQSSINDENKRAENVKNAFKIRKNAHVENKRILLIDDVITTGSTVVSCSKVLRSAGAQKIFVVSMTKTPIKSKKN